VPESLDVVVIGAGLAGVACAAHLRQRGVTSLALVEQGSGVGAFWRGNYDRIRLHSPFHDLPDDGDLRKRFGMFLARDELLAYLEAYATRHGLDEHVRFGEAVERVAKGGGGWDVRTSSGALRARAVVVATSNNRIALRPTLPGEASFGGRILHSREYRNPREFRGTRVLVVGSGNSAAEIALDLSEGGAASVAMWVRAPRHVLNLKKMGFMARVARLLRIDLTPQRLARNHAFTRTHPDFRKELAKKDAFFSRFTMDLTRCGIRAPEEGPAVQMYVRGRIPWYDQGTVAQIDRGRIEVIDGNRHAIETLVPHGVRFVGREAPFDAIVLATGFQPGLDAFLDEPDRFLAHDEDMHRRMPRTDGRGQSVVEESLFFPGFDITLNGGLSLGLWGFEVADRVVGTLGHSSR
jgi:indole-3-pyruvate monooxygenase